MRSKVKPVLHSEEIGFIDPEDCSSTVGYQIRSRGRSRKSASIYLTDCNRKIEWYFYGDFRKSLKKIDKALALLNNFRTEFVRSHGKKVK